MAGDRHGVEVSRRAGLEALLVFRESIDQYSLQLEQAFASQLDLGGDPVAVTIPDERYRTVAERILDEAIAEAVDIERERHLQEVRATL